MDTLETQRLIIRPLTTTDGANPASVRLMQRVGMRVARNLDAECVYPAFVGVVESYR